MSDYKGHRDQAFGHISYAQHFDDGMILNIFKMLGVDRPRYLDIGAHDPETISNTKLLYDRGSTGVNVEANPNLITKFNELRPGDTNVNAGVGVTPGRADFYMYSDTSGRNTFSMEEVKSLEGIMEVRTVIPLNVKTINQIVDEYCGGSWPELLSIDIEGLDRDVLETADFTKSRPLLIVVETRRHETRAMAETLGLKDYVIYCRMGENLFFVPANKFAELF